MASAIKSLPWVADEIDEHEQEVVQRLVHFATFFDSAFGSLLEKSWIHDGLNESETAVVQDLYWLAREDQAIALRILDRPWVTDGIEDLEAGAIHWLKNFRDAEVTSSVVDLAWVRDGIEEVEVKAIQQLSFIVQDDAELASSVIGLGWVQDGIEDIEWQAIRWVNNFDGGDVATSVVAMAWVRDGIEEVEVKAIQQLSFIVQDDAELASSVIGLGWVQDGIEDIEWQAIHWVNNFDGGDVATSVVAMAWMQDGVDDLEVNAIKELFFIDQDDSGVASSVVGLDWVRDRIEVLELEAIGWLNNYINPVVTSSVVDLAWVRDGIEEIEVKAIEELAYIDFYGAGEALRIVAMPFLQTLEPPDISALDSLSALARSRHDDFQRVLSHPTLSDGITDDWVKIVATLYGVSENNSDLVDTLLDPDRVTLEERVIELPLAGETHLAIIRTGPGAERSMDLLEHAVRNAEDFMGVPLPTNYVGLLFEKAVSGNSAGTNFGTHVAALPKYDVDDGGHEAEFTGSLIAHEVAHYYWRGNRGWVDEGVADLMGSLSENARAGHPVEVTNYPCAYARTIAELDTLDPAIGESEYTCNYALGERLFIDLYRSMDEDSFREGLRDLYLLSQVEDEDEGQDDTEVGIEHLKAAFKGGDAENPIVNTIAARWYNGTEPYNVSARDDSPADPRLRTVNGRIDRAYLAAVYKGPPTTSFSAQAADDWVWLFLDFSYSVGSDTEVPLELVNYYEDGFEFRRRTVTFTADARHNSSLRSRWLQVGQSPSKLWASGQYRVHVYNEGRKLVELEYEVTP